LDLLDEAGIPQPPPPIITAEDRAELATMALAQRQFYYVSAFFVGMVGGATIAYFVGYDDIVRRIIQWVLSGTGVALIVSALNLSKLFSFKCPRCGEIFFVGVGAPAKIFSKQCGTCGLPLNLPDEPSLDAD
jgi:hypothetical protein